MASRVPLSSINGNMMVGFPSTATTDAEKPKSTNKRKAADEPREEIDIDDDRCQQVDISCDRVRTKINNFINSGEMKVGEFQKAIGTNSGSYAAFMSQKGAHKGANSMVYQNAFAFFKHRELNGIKAPKKKVKKEDEDNATDVSGLKLDGEEDGEVPVFETCDEVRRKIRAYLAGPAVTQAGFCREISKTYTNGKKVTGAQVGAFLGKKGATAGNTSMVFYASYVFFEKIRLRDGKKKTKHRLDMEDLYDGGEPYYNNGNPGMDTKTLLSNQAYTVMAGSRPYEDKYGKIHIM